VAGNYFVLGSDQTLSNEIFSQSVVFVESLKIVPVKYHKTIFSGQENTSVFSLYNVVNILLRKTFILIKDLKLVFLGKKPGSQQEPKQDK
jgi:hypothetical protein